MVTEEIQSDEIQEEVHEAIPVSAFAPIKFSVTDSAIAEMKDRFMPLVINGPDDKVGFQAVYDARMIVKRSRVDVDKKRKELNEAALEHQRKVNGEAKRITGLLEVIENHLEREEKAYNDERDRIADEKAAAERQRYQGRVLQLKDWGFVFDDFFETYYLGTLIINKDDIRDFSDEEYAPTLELARQTYLSEQDRLAQQKLIDERTDQRITQLRALGFVWNAEDELYHFTDGEGANQYEVCPLDLKNLSDEDFAPIASTAQRVYNDEQTRLAKIKQKADELAEANRQETIRLQAIADQQAADQKAIEDAREQLEKDRKAMILNSRGPQLLAVGFEWNSYRYKLLNTHRLSIEDVVDQTEEQFADLLSEAKAKVKEVADQEAERVKALKLAEKEKKAADKLRTERLKPDKKAIKNHLLKVFEKPAPAVSEPESTEFLKQLYDGWDAFVKQQIELLEAL